jgi:sugar O-acyltransferase (sialic acid O-acetyltransferase NeuD family)
MIIVGAKGFAKEVLEVLRQLGQDAGVAFYDDVSTDLPEMLFNQFPILKNIQEAESYFESVGNRSFTLGLGRPDVRYKLAKKFESIGGQLVSTISPFAQVGHYDNQLSEGINLMTGSVITNSVKVGRGCLVNLNCTIGHDCRIGDFVEMSPGVHISGNCNIGAFTNLGTNATVLPSVTIGSNVVVGAGCVVTKDLPSNVVVVGLPGKVVKEISPLDL